MLALKHCSLTGTLGLGVIKDSDIFKASSSFCQIQKKKKGSNFKLKSYQ